MAADATNGAKGSSNDTSMAAINAQKQMNAESLKLNIAMGWLQMGIAMTSKISGR